MDFGEIDLKFGEFYQKGEHEGIQEATNQVHTDHFKEGVNYGRQVCECL